MSTRAAYSFRDEYGTYHVYKHHDGYPTGAAQALNAALEHAWELPRYEADEFAASFVAANKHNGGGVRLLHSGGNDSVYVVAPSDIEYRYEVYKKGNDLQVTAYSTYPDKKLFDCRLVDMPKKAEAWEKKREDA